VNKKEFLKVLEKELVHHQCEDITNLIEYYDELIEDKKESGAKEEDVIQELSISDIVRNLKAERKIEAAVKKPTISNGMKALIAFLGILSFPMLITVGAVLFALVITVLALIFSVVVTFGALFLAGIVTIIALIGAVISGQLPFLTALFILGTTLVMIGVFGMLVKWTIVASREIVAWFAQLIKTKFRKETKSDEYE